MALFWYDLCKLMGCCVSRDRGSVNSDDLEDRNSSGGKNRSLISERLKWRSDVPLTSTQLRSKREEFWDTAPAFDGRREIWDALKAAATHAELGDFLLAQAIVDGASISLPDGTLRECYDELGNRYQIPVYCLSAPINLTDDPCGEIQLTFLDQTNTPLHFPVNVCSSTVDRNDLLPLKCRISWPCEKNAADGSSDVLLECRLSETIFDAKNRLHQSTLSRLALVATTSNCDHNISNDHAQDVSNQSINELAPCRCSEKERLVEESSSDPSHIGHQTAKSFSNASSDEACQTHDYVNMSTDFQFTGPNGLQSPSTHPQSKDFKGKSDAVAEDLKMLQVPPANRQRWLFGGRDLYDHHRLADCRIPPNFVVLVLVSDVPLPYGGSQTSFRTNTSMVSSKHGHRSVTPGSRSTRNRRNVNNFKAFRTSNETSTNISTEFVDSSPGTSTSSPAVPLVKHPDTKSYRPHIEPPTYNISSSSNRSSDQQLCIDSPIGEQWKNGDKKKLKKVLVSNDKTCNNVNSGKAMVEQ